MKTEKNGQTIERVTDVDVEMVGKILTAFEVAVTSPVNADEREDLPRMFLEEVVGFDWDGWSREAQRKVLDAYLDAAPFDDLKHMFAESERWLRWHAGYLVRREYSKTTGKDAEGDDFEAWKQQRGLVEADAEGCVA